MKTFRQALIAAGIFLLQNVQLNAQRTDYKPIPDGFDFPAPEKTLLDALKAGDEAKLRTHAWMVFVGMTQPARPEDPTTEAIWETWYDGKKEVFSVGAAPQGVRTLQRDLTTPKQFLPQGEKPGPQAVGKSQMAFTLFNQELKDHTRSPENKFYLKSSLQRINRAWPPQTPIVDRKLKDYPVKAMSLKAVWMAVKKQGLTPLPIWDGVERVINAPPHDIDSWDRAILVDPSRKIIPAGEKKDTNLFGKPFPQSHVVPLTAFYHFSLTAAQASKFPDASEGDFAVLVAMHYTTKEIPNWVWATFWWHDKPNEGPFAQDRPADTVLKGLWRNYLMNVSYDMDLPKEPDATPHAVFNPWLEARFPNGVNSNCMTCHRQAVWKEDNPRGSFTITRGAPDPNDPMFKDGTKADFLWSLLKEGNK
jgi:hypothetical protein